MAASRAEVGAAAAAARRRPRPRPARGPGRLHLSRLARALGALALGAAAEAAAAADAAAAGLRSASASASFFQRRAATPGAAGRPAGGDGGEVVDVEVVAAGAGLQKLGVRLRKVALQRAAEQIAMAKGAEAEAARNARALLVDQQELVAQMGEEVAEKTSEKDDPAVPEAKSSEAEARRWALQATLREAHAKAMLDALRRVPAEAARGAVEAARGRVRADAYRAAEAAAARLPAEAAARHRQKVAATVAGAMEPYHLALLRAQKQAAEDDAKSQSAARAAWRLAGEAGRLAEGAQRLQAAGLGQQALQTMAMAHDTSEEGVNLRQWAEKLHAQAAELATSIGALQQQEGAAAASAAQNVGQELLPTLPSQPAGVAPAPAPAAPQP